MHSMTGFGRGAHATDELTAGVELSSVNRKQAEVAIHLPRSLSELESTIRKRILAKVSRGRVSVSIKLEQACGVAAETKVDSGKVLAVAKAFEEISQTLGREVLPGASDFLRIPDLFSFDEDASPQSAWEHIEPALDQALLGLLDMRAQEGGDLKTEIERILTILKNEVNDIVTRAPDVITSYREALFRRLREADLELNLEDERVLKEIGIFADRCDITEEVARLASHFSKFDDYLGRSEPIGRSLDFLCQEMNREFNTIGSKANDATLAHHVVTAKTELEKIREQVQNIE
jgi:uncharacterized protein (TIGR00255 family)